MNILYLHAYHFLFKGWVGQICNAGAEGIDVARVDQLFRPAQHNGPEVNYKG